MPWVSLIERSARGREQPLPRPLHLRRPVIGRRNDYSSSAVGVGGRRGPAKGDGRGCGGAVLRGAAGGGWRRDGARGERRWRRLSRAPAADPQPEARAAGGQRDPVPQLHFALLLPRYAPPRACALRTCRLPPRARPSPPWNRTWGDGCPVLVTARILPLRSLCADPDL